MPTAPSSAEQPSAPAPNWSIIAVLLVTLAVPGLGLFLHTPPPSDTEQRPRVPVPERPDSWAALMTYPDRLQAYVNDHFGFREPLIRLHNRIACRLLRSSPSPKVLIGESNWLFFTGDAQTDDASPVEDYVGSAPLSPAKLEYLRWLFADQHEYLKERGMAYSLFLIPSKPSLYPEHLPARIQRTGLPLWREQVTAYLQDHTDVPVIDLTEALLAGKTAYRVFIPTDSHWNDYGAFLGCQEIIRRLQPAFPTLAPMTLDSFRVRPRSMPGGDLARLLHLEHDYTGDRIVLDPIHPRQGAPTPILDEAFSDITGGVGGDTLPTAVVYRDSFGDMLVPFLTEHFSRVRYEWGQRGTQMRGIEAERPDQVLQIMTDRVLNQNLTSPARIQRAFNQRRFDTASQVLATFDATTGFSALEVRGPTPDPQKDGVALISSGNPTRIALPDLASTDLLPIIHVRIRPSASSVVLVRPWIRGQRKQPDAIGRERVETGTNHLYFPIWDPEPSAPLVLELGAQADYVLYALEIRGVPR